MQEILQARPGMDAGQSAGVELNLCEATTAYRPRFRKLILVAHKLEGTLKTAQSAVQPRCLLAVVAPMQACDSV